MQARTKKKRAPLEDTRTCYEAELGGVVVWQTGSGVRDRGNLECKTSSVVYCSMTVIVSRYKV